jgi:hypothetical protein
MHASSRSGLNFVMTHSLLAVDPFGIALSLITTLLRPPAA